MRVLAATALLLSAVPARPDPSNGLPTEFRPSFPVFGGGQFVNFLGGDNQAMTNAAAHVGFSLAVPLVGEKLWGRKGLWVTGLSWMALTLVQESLFHAPAKPGPGYPAEVRSDLITRLVPCATLLIFDAIRGGGRADVRPSVPPERPGMPWPIGLEMPGPSGSGGQAPALRIAVEPAAPDSGGGQATAPRIVGDGQVPAAAIGGGGQAPALRRADSPTECTADLLFQGSAACSWDLGRPPRSRRVAAL